LVNVILRWLSPHRPKTIPGIVATFAFSNRKLAKIVESFAMDEIFGNA